MSTIKVNNIQPLTGTTVTVVAGNSVNVSGAGKVVTPTVEGSTSLAANAVNGDITLQLNGSNKLTVLKTPTGSNKTVNVVGDLYVSGGIYGNGANISGVLAAGTGGTTSSGNLTVQYGTGGSGDAIYSANTTEVARMYYNGDFAVGAAASTPVLFVDKSSTNVGVNTNAPTADLHVVGDTKTTGSAVVGNQLIGGFGAAGTTGVTNWNDATNARSGSGVTLLYGNATNGPGPAKYFHPFSFEYTSKDGTGNMTQLAVPYTVDGVIDNTLSMRSRSSGTWSAWRGFVQQPISVSGITVGDTGLVGINNTSPANQLDVVGNSQITGRLTLAGSTAGLAFPSSQTDTNLYNCLDDYEEGTFTPTINGLVNFSSYPTNGARGTYTKIGNRVMFEMFLSFTTSATAPSGTTGITIGGLPFNSVSLTNAIYPAITVGYRSGWSATAANKPKGGYVNSGVSTITLLRDDLNAAVNSADVPASTTHTIYVSGSYITNQATA